MSTKARFTRVDNAYERLKTEILSGQLPPGFQAPEPDIATRLGMSRTPVREALIRLEADGLVDLVPRRGAKVLPISRQDICEIYQILSALEALAAGNACGKMSFDTLEEIQGVLTRADEALEREDIEAWAICDDRFHRLIARASGNLRLESKIEGLLDQVYRANLVLLRLNKAPAANVADHRVIVEAIREGKSDKATELARVHRLNGLARMEDLLQNCGLNHV
ncbi:GntR family transcriptional regulator [Stappia sp. BW2]|jgi:DNA-binding GntR family transcriptional regulator|uniref:GntR family transcriptional regulator n=1 Tax=Stappia sp. BW2 TaxID=2592622 RepID=UPI0011DEBFCA|nr:GntR family transcriptional regulator [Stappia sp. BW2]TYC75747.1 GntR family transcriptional regulator [Stappia sp. BW2]